MTCKTCRYYKNKKCTRYPAWITIDKPSEHYCGDWEQPIAVLKPPTKEELEAKKKAETRNLTDAELRKQQMERYGKKPEPKNP